MNKVKYIRLTTVAMGVSIAASAFAAEPREQFPTERTQRASCDDVEWNARMREDRPAMIDACQEVVIADGKNWARFEAKFLRIKDDGSAVFSVRDRRDRGVEEVALKTPPGQVAYIDGRETPFRELRSSTRVNLYVPEGQYGFATEPGAPPSEIATVAPRSEPSQPAAQTERVAQRDPMPSELPGTAGPLPWLALGGLFSLLGGLGLTILRRNG